MVAQCIAEQERSVSAPALWPQVADLWYSVAAKPISSWIVKRWSAERKSEQVIVVMNGGTTEPVGAKGL